MQRVDFHVFKNAEDPNFYLARLVEKIFLLQKQIFIYTSTAEDAAVIDDILWTFRPASFLPHQIITGSPEIQDPITISHQHIPQKTEVLINLTLKVPDFHASFDRIIELIRPDTQITGREKYRQYQSFGCQLHTFHI